MAVPKTLDLFDQLSFSATGSIFHDQGLNFQQPDALKQSFFR